MGRLEGIPMASLYSPLYPKHAKLIKQNEIIKHLVFERYDRSCQRQLRHFLDLFDNMLTSTFSNPWVFLKQTRSEGIEGQNPQETAFPSFDDTKERIPKEIAERSGTEATLSKWLQEIPTDLTSIDEAVDMVQMLV